jgi:hypothetical protein
LNQLRHCLRLAAWVLLDSLHNRAADRGRVGKPADLSKLLGI